MFRKLTSSILAVCAAAAVAALWALPASAKQTALRATTITVTAGKPSEFSFTLSKKSAPAGAITFKVTNGGAIPHDFKLCSSPKGTTKPNTCAGKSTPMLSPAPGVQVADRHAQGEGHLRVHVHGAGPCGRRHERRVQGHLIDCAQGEFSAGRPRDERAGRACVVDRRAGCPLYMTFTASRYG